MTLSPSPPFSLLFEGLGPLDWDYAVDAVYYIILYYFILCYVILH